MQYFLYGALSICIALFSMEKEPDGPIEIYRKQIEGYKSIACHQPHDALPYFFKYLTDYSQDATSFSSYFIICDILQFLEQQTCIQFRSQVKKYWDQHKFNIIQDAEGNAADFKKACEKLYNEHLDEKNESRRTILTTSIKERRQQLSYATMACEKLNQFDKKFVVNQPQKNIYGNAPTP
jgi:hypothetical protein